MHVDWHRVIKSPTLQLNWLIADDFQDPFERPVLTVRWWGSCQPDQGQVTEQGATGGPVPVPIGPGVEDGYLISFFRDIPGPRFDPSNPTTDFSRPDSSLTGGLLGSYVLPFDRVRVKETPFWGWDEYLIFEYEADLWDAHLDHPSEIARPDGFFQRPYERYWISIAAEVGHKLVEVTDPTGPPKQATDHYWGWHTSPLDRFDVATMTKLFMPNQE